MVYKDKWYKIAETYAFPTKGSISLLLGDSSVIFYANSDFSSSVISLVNHSVVPEVTIEIRMQNEGAKRTVEFRFLSATFNEGLIAEISIITGANWIETVPTESVTTNVIALLGEVIGTGGSGAFDPNQFFYFDEETGTVVSRYNIASEKGVSAYGIGTVGSGGGGYSPISVIDDLLQNTVDLTKALSARQGYILSGKIGEKQDIIPANTYSPFLHTHDNYAGKAAFEAHITNTDIHLSEPQKQALASFMEMFEMDVVNDSIKAKKTIYSVAGVSAYGLGVAGGGGGGADVYNGLDSDSPVMALSALQGKVLKGLIDTHNHSGVYATPSYVDQQISALVASSPETLNTLNELAAALGNDPNFATTITNQIGTKEPGLGNPASDGMILSSSAGGIRSWVNRYVLPIATAAILGGVMIGTGLSATAQGVLSHSDFSIESGIGGSLGHVKASEKAAWNNHIADNSAHMSVDERNFFNKLKTYFVFAADNSSVHTTINFFSQYGVSAYGLGVAGGGGSLVNVIDNLFSTSITEALSANMGRYLNTLISGKSDTGHVHTWESITGKPVTFAPSAHYHDDRYYTETEVANFFSGTVAISGYNKSYWDTAYGWGNHASAGYALASALSNYSLTSHNHNGTYALIGGDINQSFNVSTLTTSGSIRLPNAYYLTGNLVNGTQVALIGRNSSNTVFIDPDGYGTAIGGSLTLPSITVGTIGATADAQTNAAFNTRVDAINGDKSLYLFNNGSTFKLDAYDYATNTPLNIQIGGNGGSVNVIGSASFSSSITAVSGLFDAGLNATSNEVRISGGWASGNTVTLWVGNNHSTYKNYSPYFKATVVGGIDNYSLKIGLNNSDALTFSPNLAATFASSVSASGNFISGIDRGIRWDYLATNSAYARMDSSIGNYSLLIGGHGDIRFRTNYLNIGDTDSATRMHIANNGNIGIGYTDRSEKFAVNGTGYFNDDLKIGISKRIGWEYGDGQMYNWITNSYTNTGGIEYKSGSWTSQNIVAHNFETWAGSDWSTAFKIYQDQTAYFSKSVYVTNGTLSLSRGSGEAYSTKISTEYTYPYIDTFIDSIAGASYQGRIILRTSSEGGALGNRVEVSNNGNFLINGFLSLNQGSANSSYVIHAKQATNQYFWIEGNGSYEAMLRTSNSNASWYVGLRTANTLTDYQFYNDAVGLTVASLSTAGALSLSSFLKASSIKIGANWEAIPNGTTLELKFNGITKARINSNGDLVAYGGLSAYGIPQV